jgi:hypothetical protein
MNTDSTNQQVQPVEKGGFPTGTGATYPLGTPQQRIVAFAGLAGSGKSTAARYLIEQHGFERGKFATGLKEMTRAYLRVRQVDETTIERMIEGDLKEVPHPALEGRTPRYFMQRLGTEFGRDLIAVDVWVNTEKDRIAGMPRVVFDDARFPNEFAMIKDLGGIIVEVKRQGLKPLVEPLCWWKRLLALVGFKFAHESESYRPVPDIVIDNDGSRAALFRALDFRVLIENQ